MYENALFSGRTVIYRGPVPSTVELNRTGFLYCSASYHYSLDLAYQWAFNGRIINLDNHVHFRRVSIGIKNSRSLISAFVVRCLDSIIPLVSISEISSLCLASVAAQVGLCLTWLQTPKAGMA